MAAGDYFIITVLRHGDVVAAGVLDLVHHLVGLADDFVRAFGDYLTAAVVMAKPVLAGSQGANDMYGLIVKLTAVPGKRDEVTRILRESAGVMPECLSYVVAKDSAEENTVWVTEVWDTLTSHDASLSLPSVKNATG